MHLPRFLGFHGGLGVIDGHCRMAVIARFWNPFRAGHLFALRVTDLLYPFVFVTWVLPRLYRCPSVRSCSCLDPGPGSKCMCIYVVRIYLSTYLSIYLHASVASNSPEQTTHMQVLKHRILILKNCPNRFSGLLHG